MPNTFISSVHQSKYEGKNNIENTDDQPAKTVAANKDSIRQKNAIKLALSLSNVPNIFYNENLPLIIHLMSS